MLLKLAEEVQDLGIIESQPLQDGRNMVMMLAPHKNPVVVTRPDAEGEPQPEAEPVAEAEQQPAAEQQPETEQQPAAEQPAEPEQQEEKAPAMAEAQDTE